MDKNLISFLEDNKIEFKIHEHPAVFTVEESKRLSQINNIPGLRTKNLFLKDENKKYYLICLNGEKRLDIKKLEKELKIRHLKFASADELKKELNLNPGSVSIFGMLYAKNVNLIIDKETFDSEIVSFHPNINTSTLELKNKDFLAFLKVLNVKFEVLDL